MGFSLKPLRCGDPALPPLTAIRLVGHFPAESAHAHYLPRGAPGSVINPRRACAARVTVVVLSVCVCVCLLSQNSPLERLFVLQILSRIQRATEVEKFVGFSLEPLRSRVMA